MSLKKLLFTTALVSGCVMGVAGIATVASADAVEDQIEKAELIAGSIEGMVSAFTVVAIAPVGMSSAVKCFRHIVLANV